MSDMFASKKLRWSVLLGALVATMAVAPSVLLGTSPAGAATMLYQYTLNETMSALDNSTATGTINVTGATGAVTFMEVEIPVFRHTHPADMDLKITGPNGQSVILMSDVPSSLPGCAADVDGVNLRFADNGNALPFSNELVSGYYDTYNDSDEHDCGVVGGTDLSASKESFGAAFYGISPNGAWTVEMADDGPGDFGFISDVRLTFYTAIRATSTTVVCTPDPAVVAEASTCRATVSDIEGAGVASTPQGTVTFTKTGVAGNLGHTSCRLGSSGSCSVAFTPTVAGRATVIGTYAGNLNHRASKDDDSFTAADERRSSSTTVLCTPSAVFVGAVSTCTIKVADTAAGAKATPTGKVSITKTGGAGTLSATSCPLSSGKCTVRFKPSAAGKTTIKASYLTKALHGPSAGSDAVTGKVPRRLTSTTVQCTPNAVNVGADSTCTATVADIQGGTKVTPTGKVNFTKTGNSGAGTFSATSCTLASGKCTVKYRPSAGGATTVKGTYAASAVHGASTGGATVTGRPRSTSTTVVCSGFVLHSDSTCTVTVADTASGTKATPTGTVNFTTTGGPGTLSATSCTLASGTCAVSYTPSGDGITTVSGAYVATAIHSASTGTSSIDHRAQ
jgi:hypothetical protein